MREIKLGEYGFRVVDGASVHVTNGIEFLRYANSVEHKAAHKIIELENEIKEAKTILEKLTDENTYRLTDCYGGDKLIDGIHLFLRDRL